MNFDTQLNGLNDLLAVIYGSETQLPTLLRELGFEQGQVEHLHGAPQGAEDIRHAQYVGKLEAAGFVLNHWRTKKAVESYSFCQEGDIIPIIFIAFRKMGAADVCLVESPRDTPTWTQIDPPFVYICLGVLK